MKKVGGTLKQIGLGILGIVFFIGIMLMGSSTGYTMPNNAELMLDVQAKEYISPPCLADMDKGDVEDKILKREYVVSTSREAKDMDYSPNKDCRDQGGFTQDGRSLPFALLEKVGLFPKLKSRWNANGTWNWWVYVLVVLAFS